jgi:hypothetical protein
MSWPDPGPWTPRSPQKTHNRAKQAGLLRPGAGPGAWHMEPPCAEMPARPPAAAVVWWWRWVGGGGPVAGGVVRGRGAAAVRGGE